MLMHLRVLVASTDSPQGTPTVKVNGQVLSGTGIYSAGTRKSVVLEDAGK